jgi:hypothetical protein
MARLTGPGKDDMSRLIACGSARETKRRAHFRLTIEARRFADA